ncbi:class I SAM-dependent methyltransferase [Thalassospira sp. CH_XMU1448-2]|jgi:SAM-dependent methyltransferase|uniref:class I SAM-dependent methyltransferase n=1 Tax=Thalassospira sp. CH_XMU1448-2 TaxID=3107773 RepID=UPI00300ACCBA
MSEEMRFGFGKNWAEFVERRFSEEVIAEAKAHLAETLRVENLKGQTFLDIGCGSGIHSLAALQLGAEKVLSFDYDLDSVTTTKKIREMSGSPSNWEVMQGSVLDQSLMKSLPKFDVVYSWGVLHHTGDMWSAVKNAGIPLKEGGVFYIALYSSDNYVSPPPSYWMKVKYNYNKAGALGKRLAEWRYMLRFHFIPELLAGRNPIKVIRDYGLRGMTYWTDVKDWLGGWPMDFASLSETQDFCKKEFDLQLCNVITGEGCTEYVFANPELNAHWKDILSNRVQIPLKGDIKHSTGKRWVVSMPELADKGDGDENPRRSKLMLYEDGVMLGLAHSLHDHIAVYGGGRFSHWGDRLYFSTSDGTDPIENGRSYTFCEHF